MYIVWNFNTIPLLKSKIVIGTNSSNSIQFNFGEGGDTTKILAYLIVLKIRGRQSKYFAVSCSVQQDVLS